MVWQYALNKFNVVQQRKKNYNNQKHVSLGYCFIYSLE